MYDEKIKNEAEYKNRNEMQLKIIANLRTEKDTLKQENTENHIEIQELRAENLAIKEIAEHR